MLLRKATFRLYPTREQERLFEQTLGLHCRAYNALLEEHKRRYEAGEPTFTFNAMCKALTEWRARSDQLRDVNAQSLQVTAKRASLAFEAFFRRIAEGDTPGYPRFKSFERFSGWGYKTHGDGFKLVHRKTRYKAGQARSYGWGKVKLSGIGLVRMRGGARFPGEPRTAEVLHRAGKWYLSVTVEVTEEAVARKGGTESTAFDWGIETLLTQVVGDALTGEVCTVENPRWLKKQLEKLASLQRTISALEDSARAAFKTKHPDWTEEALKRFPRSAYLRTLYKQLRATHGRIARQRHDFYHKLTAALVTRFGLIVTEELSISNLSRRPAPRPLEDGTFAPNGAAAKAGLNRAILDAAPAGFLTKLRTKAEEAGSKFVELPTRSIKPSQRCHRCGDTHPMPLDERVYRCACAATLGRDENAARTLLRVQYEGAWWENEQGAGTVPAAGLAFASP